MRGPIRLFVSSSPDLNAEREVLGQAVAQLPISVGWEIKHTPRAGEDVEEALAFIAACHLYVLSLGADFAAPMGLEWRQALDPSQPQLLAYLKRTLHSPAAQAFLRGAQLPWKEFETPAELKALITEDLAQTLLDHGEHLGLHVDDVEGLLAVLGGQEEPSPPDTEQRTGAGRGGVIMGRGT